MTRSERSNSQGILVREDVRVYDGLTQVDVDMLDRLRTVSGAEGRWLAKQVGVPGKSIGSKLRALARRGLIYASPEDEWDGRPLWRLTSRGRELVE